MAINPYSPCPGGLGKKVKFCCADLVSELDKIDRLREADQRMACLDHIEKLEAKYPNRACLMTAKADLLRDLGRGSEADLALKAVLEQNAANPVALAEAALLASEEGDGRRAMSLLQQALRVRQDPMSDKVVAALHDTAIALLEEDEIVAGRQLLGTYCQLLQQDRQAQSMLADLGRSRAIPLLLKQPWTLDDAPADAAWKDEYEAALAPMQYIAWAEAEEKLAALAQREPKSPAIVRSLAIVRSWLADHRGATEAWRKYAALEIPLDDAVEAEAVAQLLDPDAPDFVDRVHVEQQVHDLERIMEILGSHPRFAAMDVSQFPMPEGVPPPKAVCLILNRPKQAEDAPLDYEATPQVIGRLMLYGRETDREPRLEISAYRGHCLDACQKLLSELTFGMLGSAREESVIERVAQTVVDLELRWFVQKPPPPDQVEALRVRRRNEYLSEIWPHAPQQLLAGKSPEQAAQQASLRIPLAAALLRLETQIEQAMAEFDFDALRRRLNLPLPAACVADSSNWQKVPLVRWSRLNLQGFEEPALATIALRCIMDALVKATRRCMEELLRRTVQKRSIPEGLCYQHLAMCAEDSQRKLEYLERASQLLDRDKLSSAAVDIQRLQLYIERHEEQQALEVIVHLIDEHLNDQHYGPLVIETLAGLGLVRPDGRILRPKVDRPSVAAGGDQAGKIWTPDSERPANKPALWVPGS